MTKNLPKIIFVLSNNAITSKVFRVFYEIKSNEKLIKLSFWSYILLYTLRKIFPQNMPWYSEYYGNLVIFVILGGSSWNFFCLMWLEWTLLRVFQRIRTEIYTSTYFPEKLFSKFARTSQILQKLCHFFIIILHGFL